MTSPLTSSRTMMRVSLPQLNSRTSLTAASASASGANLPWQAPVAAAASLTAASSAAATASAAAADTPQRGRSRQDGQGVSARMWVQHREA